MALHNRALVVDLIDQALRSRALRALTLTNLLFLAVHLFVATAPNEEAWTWSRYLRIDHDRSLSEWFETVQLATAMLLLLSFYYRFKQLVFLIMTVLVAVMIIDNLLEVRLHVGRWLYSSSLGFGELMVVTLVAPFFAVAVWVQYRETDEQQRVALAAMILVLTLFGLFAIVADLVPELMVGLSSTAYGFCRLIEDGGELLTVSLFTVVVWLATQQSSLPPTRAATSCGPDEALNFH